MIQKPEHGSGESLSLVLVKDKSQKRPGLFSSLEDSLPFRGLHDPYETEGPPI